MQSYTVTYLRCEYAANPIGMGERAPRLSWIIQSTDRGVLQTAYQVVVTIADDTSKAVWDSGRVESGKTSIVYAGKALESRRRYNWKVRVWDNKGRVCESDEAFWEMGLLEDAEWQAKWIRPGYRKGKNDLYPVAYLRKSFDVTRKVIIDEPQDQVSSAAVNLALPLGFTQSRCRSSYRDSREPGGFGSELRWKAPHPSPLPVRG